MTPSPKIKINFLNIITHSTPTYYKRYPGFISSEQNIKLIYIISYAFYIPRPYYPFFIWLAHKL